MELSDSRSYKGALKATSLFGGVQIYTILIRIIRSKFIAVLLGPAGMGVVGLYTATSTLLSSITSLGLSSSAVKNISEANASGDKAKLVKVVCVFRKLVWFTGFLGMLTCALLSPLLSRWTFGNDDFTLGFVILSLSLLFEQLTKGQTTILQGLHKYAYMAKANVYGNTIGLFVTVPLYYFFGVDAVAPVLVISSITALVLSQFYYKKIRIHPIEVNRQLLKKEGTDMVIMGISISFSGIITTLVSYLIRIFIKEHGGIEDVGLFTAGFTIVHTYVGLVITAMGTDYYPRLSEVNEDRAHFNETINNQMEIGFILLAPLICAFIIFIELIVVILYSGKFHAVEPMMYWAVFAVYFQIFSWAIAFSFLAKGDYKLFIFNELLAKAYTFPAQVLGYYWWGLEGIGFAFVFNYVLYSLQVYVICKHRYNVEIKHSTFLVFLKQLPLMICCLVLIKVGYDLPKYILGSLFIVFSAVISYIDLDKRMDIKAVVQNKFLRGRKR